MRPSTVCRDAASKRVLAIEGVLGSVGVVRGKRAKREGGRAEAGDDDDICAIEDLWGSVVCWSVLDE